MSCREQTNNEKAYIHAVHAVAAYLNKTVRRAISLTSSCCIPIHNEASIHTQFSHGRSLEQKTRIQWQRSAQECGTVEGHILYSCVTDLVSYLVRVRYSPVIHTCTITSISRVSVIWLNSAKDPAFI